MVATLTRMLLMDRAAEIAESMLAAAWAQAVGSFIAAGLTLIAVAAAIWTAVIANRTAKEARAGERETTDKLIEVERQSALTLAETQITVNERQLAAARFEWLQEAARRSAAHVTVEAEWRMWNGQAAVTGDGHAAIESVVRNDGPTPITDVDVSWDRNWGLPETLKWEWDSSQQLLYSTIERIEPGERGGEGRLGYVLPHPYGTFLYLVVEFTDAYGDRWRRDQRGVLTLLNPLRVTEEPLTDPPEQEWVTDHLLEHPEDGT